MVLIKKSNASNTRRIALFSTFVAVTTALQLARPWGWLVEFTTFLTFSTGVVFGSLFGASLGAFVMFVNAFLSPFGLAGLNMPFQMLGMSVIGASGGFYKMEENNGKTQFFVESAVLGALLTFFYYTFFTNLGFALQMSLFSQASFLQAFVLVQVEGAIVTAIYVISNTALFGAGVVPLVSAMKRVLGR